MKKILFYFTLSIMASCSEDEPAVSTPAISKFFGTCTWYGKYQSSIFSLEEDGTDPNFITEVNGSVYGKVIESGGKLWGMTSNGGANKAGMIFRVDLNGSNFSVIHDFDIQTGYFTQGSLIEGNGKFWGSANIGGAHNKGVIFSLSSDGKNYQVVQNFNGTDGISPSGHLIYSNGKLWGIADGGIYNKGSPLRYDLLSGSIFLSCNYSKPPLLYKLNFK